MSGPIVLSIGTTHPWNVAGVGRDLAIGGELHARVFTAVAAVSAQDATGVRGLQAIRGDVFAAQLQALPWAAAGAVRIGALPTAENASLVAALLRLHPQTPAVVDPVFAASQGGDLADAAARAVVRDELAVLPGVILTPNLAEAAQLLGIDAVDRDSIADAAQALARRGPMAVLVKGGHLNGEPADALATAAGVELLAEPRIAAGMRGTGCTLAMVLACELARGADLRDAVVAARTYVRAQLAAH
ncbi:MAG TPA: bifunctional hydroxymethylpyrimidine kinase/phosphomethylpyrimidine kinase [Candidatus Acidoferrales bacterium]|jgi:hydroxymethylpyrimidine/phosphomethylpyrimidine kinase|nr:bifunctional hydroxymethylpyrimidine kinase/phosphomethylpyrimidine kinase [Candidatus Acidoferrales bacterium]